MTRLLLVGLIVVWLAQAAPPDLIVTLRDAAGAPVPAVTVLIHDAGGSHVLAQAQTDAAGVATFPQLAERQVRVAVRGTLPDGTALAQPGDDAAGIRLRFDPRPVTLALLSDSNGQITPDPATMAREIGGPLVLPARVAPTPSPAGATRFPPVRSRALAIGLFAFALLIGVAIGMVVMQRRPE